jgi:ABC-type polysaccharide/polyol phosphate export permease
VAADYKSAYTLFFITPVPPFLTDLYKSRHVIGLLVKQQLTLRYRRTAFGFLWTLINPLMMMSVMAVVFSSLFKADLKTFVVFLFSGMIPWNFFNAVVMQSGTSFINNEGLIKKIYIPKAVFPLSIAAALMIDSIFSFIALFIIILLVGGSLSWAVFFIPLAYVLLFFFSFGIGLISAVTTVFFRDLQYVISIIMQGLFFLTPIFYKHEALQGDVAAIVNLNPVLPFIELFRAPLNGGQLPDMHVVIYAAILSVLAMVVGLVVFFREHKKIVFRL